MARLGHLFVVAYGRSGSTLVQAVLNAMPGVCVRGENNLAIQHVYRFWRTLRTAQREFGERYDQANQPWHGIAQVDADAAAQAIAAQFDRYVLNAPEDAEWLGFKEIRYHEANDIETADLLSFIDQFFANSRFVFVCREPADVARSSWWRRQQRETAVSLISRLNAEHIRLHKLWPDRSCVIDYDELAENSDEAAKLFTLIGRSYDRDLVRTVLNIRLTH
jgi:hypothetical protein